MNSSYSLRENPKKTKKRSSCSSDLDVGDGELYRCSKCSKFLSSWNHLFEHMRIHSGKKRASNCAVSSAVPKRRRGSGTMSSSMIANGSCSSVSASVSMSVQFNPYDEDGAIAGLIMLSKGILGCRESSYECSDDKNLSHVEWGNERMKRVDETVGFVDTEFSNKCRLGELDVISLGKIGSFDSSASDFAVFDEMNLGSRSRFECADCRKVFSSYRALGGHRASHNRMRRYRFDDTGDSACFSVIDQSFDRLCLRIEDCDAGKKTKGYKCEICGKVLMSGQALGRHRKCHLNSSSETAVDDANCYKLRIQQQTIVRAEFIDLNQNLVPETENRGDSSSINWGGQLL